MARILIVDDDEQIRTLTTAVLQRAGFETATALEGGEALRAYQEQPADVVLCDLYMPGKDGIETIRDLRQQFPEVKIVAMSGGGTMSGGSALRFARNLGARELLPKPFNAEDLLLVVQRLVDAP
jgi:CheY-like chemotaxis protein